MDNTKWVEERINGNVYLLDMQSIPKKGDKIVALSSYIGKYTNQRVQRGNEYLCQRLIGTNGSFYVGDGIAFSGKQTKRENYGIIKDKR